VLAEVIPKTIGANAFYPWRFRKIDYEFAENIIAKLIEEEKEEKLI